MKKRIISLITTLCLLLSGIPVYAVSIPETDPSDTINIIHINDVHGYAVETSSAIGYAKIAGFVEEYKNANPDNTLFVDSGDVFQGNAYATFDNNESLIKILNTLQLDAMTAGNSDYMIGLSQLKANADALNYPILGANIVKKGTDTLADGTQPYFIKELENGLAVGIIGITTSGSLIGNTENYEWLDPVETARKYVNEIKDQVDVLIGLVHLGIGASDNAPAKQVAEGVPEFNLLIDGHSHDVYNDVVNGVPIVQAGSYSSGVGIVTVTLEDDSVSTVTEEYHAVGAFEKQVEKTDTKNATEELLTKYAESMDVVVGSTDVFLEATRDIIRVREANMGNVFSDAVRLYTGADVALIPSGNIGGDVGPGDITMGDVMTMARITGTITTKELTGAQLLKALNASVSQYPAQYAGMKQVSGLKLAFNPELKGDRIVRVEVGGEVLELDKVYTVAVFTNVKDSYEGIKDGVEIREWDFTYNILKWYFNEYSPIKTGVEGRMLVVAGTITYHLNDGTNDSKNPDVYTGETDIILYEPSKPGYTFGGWYTDSGFGTKTSQINAGTKGDIELYAKWELIKTDISKATIAAIDSQTYTGSPITPDITVRDNGNILKKGTDYTVAYNNHKNPGTATVTITGTGNYTGTQQATFKIEVQTNKVSRFRQSKKSATSINLSWSKTSGATGYEIYRRSYKSDTYKRIKTITKNNTTSYTDRNLSPGRMFQYKIRAYRTVNGKKYYSGWSGVINANTTISRPVISKAGSSKKKQVSLTWKKINGVTGYEIYRATKTNGNYQKMATVRASRTKYVDNNATSNKTYYYKIRSFKTMKDQKIYSSYSKAEKVKVK